MTRPIYETDANLEDQARIIRPYCKRFGYEAVKTEDLERADYTLTFQGEAVAVAKMKRRHIRYFEHSTILLSTQKVEALLAEDLPAIFIVGFNNGIGWVRLTQDHLDTSVMGGRTVATLDQGDIEPCCYIPLSNFTGVTAQDGLIRSDSPYGDDEIQVGIPLTAADLVVKVSLD